MQLATMQRPEQKDHEASVFPANVLKGPEELAKIVSSFASSVWMDRQGSTQQPTALVMSGFTRGLDYDIWAISWMPEQSTGFHDHGESSGAFIVVTGVLEEHRPDEQPLLLHPGDTRAFGSDYAHDVRNASIAPAVSIHAYSPPLSEMNKFELDGSLLIPRERASEFAERLDEKGRARRQDVVEQTRPSGIDHLLAVARGRLRRLSPLEAYEAATFNGAILVDIRPENQRGIEGSIPGRVGSGTQCTRMAL